MLNITSRIYESIENEKQRSAWDKGVTLYSLELVEQLDEAIESGYFSVENIAISAELEQALLNGAANWNQYSWGGNSLIYDSDIAERLCTPSKLKKTRQGERRPNSREEWLDTQARALHQACKRLKRHARRIVKEA